MQIIIQASINFNPQDFDLIKIVKSTIIYNTKMINRHNTIILKCIDVHIDLGVCLG